MTSHLDGRSNDSEGNFSSLALKTLGKCFKILKKVSSFIESSLIHLCSIFRYMHDLSLSYLSNHTYLFVIVNHIWSFYNCHISSKNVITFHSSYVIYDELMNKGQTEVLFHTFPGFSNSVKREQETCGISIKIHSFSQ